ncbi:MAG: hypothetical protein SAK29_34595 [Scytonema sp. PMC 1069.18]|nr:hypothetical protein [Scytonema sp. PMC 1069.18]MEC4887770.1 hypothetical protein [Scytonema sp. PMC 1070.18]
MHPDLIGLEITKGELRRLIGLNPDNVFRPSILQNREQRLGCLKNEIAVVLVLTPIIVGFIYAFIILPIVGSSIVLGVVLLFLVPISVVVGRWLWRWRSGPKTLTVLLDKVGKYHSVIKAIDTHDQLATPGNENRINDREKVVAALQLVREDLVRALKMERVLRDNKKSLANNQELFVNNVEMLHTASVQMSDRAGEYAQLLNQSLQIALDVQAEVRKLTLTVNS